MMTAKQQRVITVLCIAVASISLIATVALTLLAIWQGDHRFAETAFLTFVLLVISAPPAIALGIS